MLFLLLCFITDIYITYIIFYLLTLDISCLKRTIKITLSMIDKVFLDHEYLFQVPGFSFKEKVLIPFGGVVTVYSDLNLD